MLQTSDANLASASSGAFVIANSAPLPDTYCHWRAHFLYADGKPVEVLTDDGMWMAPPRCGVWIPAGTRYRVRIPGGRSVSVYADPGNAPRASRRCEVVGVSPLLHELLAVAAGVRPCRETGRYKMIMRLILMELQRAQAHCYHIGLPSDIRLSLLCRSFLHRPSIRSTAREWGTQLGMSESAFTRTFRRETGLAFGAWRQQACLLAALSMLSPQVSVSRVGFDLGYESANAFAIMFRRMAGQSPSAFVAQAYGTLP
jgi:AraC-like DNA-binding protein